MNKNFWRGVFGLKTDESATSAPRKIKKSKIKQAYPYLLGFLKHAHAAGPMILILLVPVLTAKFFMGFSWLYLVFVLLLFLILLVTGSVVSTLIALKPKAKKKKVRTDGPKVVNLKEPKLPRFNWKPLAIGVLGVLVVSLGAWWWLSREAPVAQAEWWNDTWMYRKVLTVNPAYVAGDLTDFPMLVSFTDSDVGAHAQADGDDFVFIDSAGEKLKHEIESYASTTGTLVAWVKVPRLSGSEHTQIRMYYGNANVGSQERAEDVWDENYVGVWHLPNDSAASTTDSSMNSNDGVAMGDAIATTSGQIGAAFEFDGGGDYIEADDSSTMDIGTGNATWSLWVALNDAGSNFYGFMSHTNGSSATDGWWITKFPGGNVNVAMNDLDHTSDSLSWATSTWYYVTAVKTGNDISFYRNGSYISNDNQGTGINNSNGTLRIGMEGSTYSNQYMDGRIDEVRISNTNRSAAWIETEYNNQNSPATFFSASAEEVGPGPVGYWSFDEGYGSVARDASGQGNDGTISGAEWVDASQCISGKCLYFDGVDYTEVNADVKDNMSEFTACTWFKANSLTNADGDNYIYLISKQWALGIENNNILKWVLTRTAYPNYAQSQPWQLKTNTSNVQKLQR